MILIRVSSMAKEREHAVTSFDQWLEKLQEAGFAIGQVDGGRALISKHGCAAVLQQGAAGEPRFAVWPGIATREGIAHLIDRGFQKFWEQGGRQFPAVAAQLQGLHRFDQDLRALMGLTSLYNEALGTVSSRYLYDRVDGREKPKRRRAF
jgi:hypothetical protein